MSSHQSPRQNYPEFVENFGRGKNPETAAKLAVGGDFEAVGIIEREALRYYGLSETGYLIDVGCGSGRLAIPLARDFHGRYLGTDVVPSFIEFAANAVSRPDWRFELVDSIVIPEVDNSADMVCFFSVFTHLLHEQTYLYLEEARRVLKPGGKVVFSFLEFPVDWHWTIFMTTVEDIRTGRPSHLNMFVDRYALEVFASHLGLRIDEFRDALERFVPLPYPVTHDNGVRMEDFASVGQSVCVMSKA